MRLLITATVLIATVNFGFGADPTLEERVAQLEKRQTATEKKLDSADAKLDAILRAVSAKPAAQSVQLATQPAAGLRAAVGHTHTCANGHTWDHTMDNGTHICPFCGLPQTIVDNARKAVTAGTPAVQQSGYYQLTQGTAFNSGGCANGQCSAPQQVQRRGIFGLRR